MKALIIIFAVLSLSVKGFSQEKDSIYVNPETPPSFPGGMDSLKTFISKNLKYPQIRLDVEGSVFIQFIVNEDGSLSDSKIGRGLCEPCNKNALELFSKMPKWIPGKILDKTVKTKMVFPIKFTLSQ